MAETLKILKNENSGFAISEGKQTISLMDRFSKLTPQEKQTLLDETVVLLSNCNPPTKEGNATGIAIGYVQSGKTMSFTTLTALAVENGFRIVIYFAGIKLNLLEQTTKRLKKDLLTETENARNYKVYQSPSIKDDVEAKI